MGWLLAAVVYVIVVAVEAAFWLAVGAWRCFMFLVWLLSEWFSKEPA